RTDSVPFALCSRARAELSPMTSLPFPRRTPRATRARSNPDGSFSLPVLRADAAHGGGASSDASKRDGAASLAGSPEGGGRRRIRKSKAGPLRAAVLLGVHVAFLVHVLFWLRDGRTVSPVEPSESM